MWRGSMVGFVLAAVLLLAACGEDEPARRVTQGEALYTVSFEAPGTWEEGRYPAEAADPDAVLAVLDGRYRIDFRAGDSASFIWGAGGDPVEDALIEVRAEQLSAEDDNLYGVACRLVQAADGSASGYALLISGDGHYSIAQLTRTSLTFLLDWHQSSAIKRGQAANTLRAVCADDYLALYANGTFLGDVTLKGDALRRPGQVGLIAGVNKGAAVSIAFDDLTVTAVGVSD